MRIDSVSIPAQQLPALPPGSILPHLGAKQLEIAGPDSMAATAPASRATGSMAPRPDAPPVSVTRGDTLRTPPPAPDLTEAEREQLGEANWSDQNACWKSGLKNDKLAVTADGATVGYLPTGLGQRSYALASDGPSPLWKTYVDGEKLRVEAPFSLVDQMGGVAARVPNDCRLELRNVRLGYDLAQIDRDLDHLKAVFAPTRDLVAKTMVLHGMYLESRAGALCSIGFVASQLRAIEDVSSFEKLSQPSIVMIDKALQTAVSVGAIRAARLPTITLADGQVVSSGWKYFLENSRDFEQEAEPCRSIAPEQYIPSPEHFVRNGAVLNQRAYDNAVEFQAYHQRLLDLQRAGWALVHAATASGSAMAPADWIADAVTAALETPAAAE